MSWLLVCSNGPGNSIDLATADRLPLPFDGFENGFVGKRGLRNYNNTLFLEADRQRF